MNDSQKVIQAFPVFLKDDVLSLLDKIYLESEHSSSRTFGVFVDNQKLEIPCRIYFDEPQFKNLTETELLILNCFFTRHCDGFIRQKRLKQILESREYWISPYVLHILGEYVYEILVTIEENLSESLLENLIRLINENPKLVQTIKSRIISYWDCYYRDEFPVMENYAGFRILNRIKESSQIKLPNRVLQ